MRIKCFRFECIQCGEASSIQVFYRKDGSVGYARARHKNKQGFHYHTNNQLNMLKRKLLKGASLTKVNTIPIKPLVLISPILAQIQD